MSDSMQVGQIRLGLVLAPPTFGGLHNLACKIAPTLKNEGIDTIAYVSDASADDVATRLSETGILVKKVPLARFRRATDLAALARTAHTIHNESKNLAEALSDDGIDVVQSYGMHHFHGYLASRRTQIPLVLSFNSDTLSRAASYFAIPMVGHARHILLEGTGIARAYPWLRRFKNRITVFYPPAPPPRKICREVRYSARQELAVQRHVPVIGTIGNFGPQKGHDDLIDVANLLVEADPMVQVIVLGQPLNRHQAYHKQLLERAANLGLLNDNLHFISSDTPAAELLPAFDVFVLTSRTEGVATATLEALSWGLPVVAFDVGSVRDIVRNGETGLLVRPRDTRGLAGAIRYFLEHPAEARLAGVRGRNVAASHQAPDLAAIYATVYREVLGDNPSKL